MQIILLLIIGEQLSAFEVIISQLLEDVQERLVYRAQVEMNLFTSILTTIYSMIRLCTPFIHCFSYIENPHKRRHRWNFDLWMMTCYVNMNNETSSSFMIAWSHHLRPWTVTVWFNCKDSNSTVKICPGLFTIWTWIMKRVHPLWLLKVIL